MRSQPRSFMTVLALLSLLATVMPSVAWACPVTGRIGTAVEVCAASAKSRHTTVSQMACCRKMPSGQIACVSLSAHQPCADAGGNCCHGFPAPNLLQIVATLASKTAYRSSVPLQHYNTLDLVATGLPFPDLTVPVVLPIVYRPDISPPHSQHAHSLHSGRAPPVA